MTQDETSIPYGFCKCGCGQETNRWKQTQRTLGRVEGEPATYIRGHHSRILGQRWTVEDRGYDTPCWVWQGALCKGYGRVYVGGGRAEFKARNAHTVEWEKINGPVPEGLELDHLCSVPACVNPAHLEAVTHGENMRRWLRARRERRTA
jgi:hypothetical protein